MYDDRLADRFHRVLVDEIRSRRPELLDAPFSVAEIYQDLVPYRTHRDRLGVEMNGDYEHLLLRLLAGEGEFLILESEVAQRELRSELDSPNPNTGIFRDFAAAEVRLNPGRLGGAPEPTAADAASNGGREMVMGDQSYGDEAVDHEDEAVPVESLAPSHDPAEIDAPVPHAATAAQASSEDGDDEIPTCRWCREELPRRDDLNFCPFCGTDIHVVPCEECGAELEPGWRFCIACGTEVTAD